MDEREAMVRRVSFCAGLDDAAVVALASISAPLRRPAGAFVQFEGDPAGAMYIVAEGHVKIARTSASGREQVLNVLGPGSHFNTVPIFDGGDCPANAQALTDVALLALPRDAMRRWSSGTRRWRWRC
jgi:CRP-like cAMP-binding protein